MRIKVTPGNARLGATVIVIIVIGLYEGHENSSPYSLPREHRTEEATRSSGSTIESRCRSDRQGGKQADKQISRCSAVLASIVQVRESKIL